MTKKIKNKDLKMDLRVKHEDDSVEQSGRSMVEMLGVLAVVGVLSVGGIAGYTYSMNKYYANELLAGASARAVIVASQLASGRDASLTEFEKMETAGGEFDNKNIAKFSDGFGIKVSKVKKAVCENLIKDTEDTDIGIETEAGGEVTCADENTFFITFDSLGISGGETGGSCTESSDKCDGGTYYVCENGKWVAQSGLTCNGNNVELSDSCKSNQAVCLKGTPYTCCGGDWMANSWYYCCDGNKLIEGGDNACIDGVSYSCCGGNWEERGPCCEGNVPENGGRCVNGQAQVCCAGEWFEYSWGGCCYGDEFVEGGKEACVNGGYKVCCAGNWYSTPGCCNGEEIVDEYDTTNINGKTYRCQCGQLWLYETCNDDGATKCMDGKYYTCCAGEWFEDSWGGCCYGDTAVPNWEYRCINGKYKNCCTGTWVDSWGACCNGDDVVAEGNITFIDGKKYLCSSGQLWLRECEDGEGKCENGTAYYCSSSKWDVVGCCIEGGENGTNVIAVGGGACFNGQFMFCSGGTFVRDEYNSDNLGCCSGGSEVADIDTQRCRYAYDMYIQETCISGNYGDYYVDRAWLGNAGPDCCDENGNLVTCTCDNWVYAGAHPDECS